MAFTFYKSESIRFGIRRIIREQVNLILLSLGRSADNYDEEIHSSRKSMKKIRALLALIKFELGREEFRRINIFYRDIGRKLSGVRDLAVMMNFLVNLKKDAGIPNGKIDRILFELDEEYHQTKINRKLEDNIITGIKNDLLSALKEIDEWQFSSTGFDVIKPGLQRVYSEGLGCMHTAIENPLPENYHKWRKHGKYLWYSVKLLQKSWKNVLTEYSNSLEDLTESLGEAQDISQIRKYLTKKNIEDGNDNNYLLAILAEKREALYQKAIPLGKKIFSENPESFTARMESYYKIWRGQKREIRR